MNKGRIAMIHVAKKQTGMTEEEYRDLLASVGVKSSKELTRKQFSVVVNHFKQLGFKPKSKSRLGNSTDNLPSGKRYYMKKIDAILQDLGKDRIYADGLAKKRFKVEKVHWLNPNEIRKVMIMLIYHQKRQQNRKGRKVSSCL